METKEPFDFEDFKQQAIKGLYEGKPINGEMIQFNLPSQYISRIAWH